MDEIMRPASSRQKRRPQLDSLRAKIRALEPQRPNAVAMETLALAPGLHEICPVAYLDTPAALGFQTGLLAQTLKTQDRPRPVVWVRPAADSVQDFGRPYPLALKQWGVPPEQLLLVEARESRDVLWALEEGLRAGALVMGEIGGDIRYDLTASKRLHLAAIDKQAVALLLGAHDVRGTSAALTRWRIAAQPSTAQAWTGATGLPGLGNPSFRVELERVRGGPPRRFEIEWKHAAFHVLEPAPMADRTIEEVRRQAG